MIDPPVTHLPAVRRAEMLPERIYYVARAGFGALPSGFATVLGFMVPQVFALSVVLWAIWWPYPMNVAAWWRAVGCTVGLGVAIAAVAGLLIRRNPGFVMGVMRAPFIRITVTDRRVVWTLPWLRDPLIDIGRARITHAVLGEVDRRGRGNAAMALVPGDPMADIDGHIHFDRLPHAERFVAALGQA